MEDLIGKIYVCPITRYTMRVMEEATYPYPEELEEGETAYLVSARTRTFTNVHAESYLRKVLAQPQLEPVND